MTWNRETVRANVVAILRDALAPDVDEIQDTHTLGDLGVWPVDLLDIQFRLRKVFGIDAATPDEVVKLKRDENKGKAISVLAIVNRIEDRLGMLAAT